MARKSYATGTLWRYREKARITVQFGLEFDFTGGYDLDGTPSRRMPIA